MSNKFDGAQITNSFRREKIKVEDILLWHDNPRNTTKIREQRPLSVISKLDSMTYENMLQNAEIGNLVRTILNQGWQDDGDIMVGFLAKDDKYFVLEGNRRITALRVIIDDYNNGYETCQRYPSKKNIHEFYNKYLKDGISCKVAHSKLTNDPPIPFPGDAATWKKETWRAIEQWISNIHQSGKLNWGLDARIADVFNIYMRELHEHDHSVDVTRVESFYMNEDIAKSVADSHGMSFRNFREMLFTTTLIHQCMSKLVEMGGQPPEKGIASVFTEGLLKSPILKERFGFDEPDNGREGRLYGGESLELFVSMFFDIGDKKKVITASASGDSNARQYSYVLKNDNSENKKFISMIEEERMPAGVVKGLLLTENESFEVIKILELINKKLKHPSIEELTETDMDDDRLVEIMHNCVEGFDRLRRLLKEV